MALGQGQTPVPFHYIKMMLEKWFHEWLNEDPHAYLNYFSKIVVTVLAREVSHDQIKWILFPYTLFGKADQWHHMIPPNDKNTSEKDCFWKNTLIKPRL